MIPLWQFFLNKHHFTMLLMAVLVMGGIFAAIMIPKESSPEVQIPMGIVTTVLPGASAEDVEELITNKLEDRIIGLERVSRVTSTSGDGVSSITVEFDASANIESSIQLLKDEVDKAEAELPAEAEDPMVTDVNFADQPILIASISGDLAPAELTALGNAVKDEIERVPGVSSVALTGVRERQVQVIVEQAKLRQYGLSLSDVTTAIRTSGIATPLGSIRVSGVEYAVRLEAGATEAEDIANVALTGPGSTALRVRDVANVVNGLEDPRTFSRVSVEGNPSQPALTLSIFKSRGGNIVDTGHAIKDRLAELEQTTLAGTKTVISYDASKDVEHDLTELTRVGMETMVLVMLVLFLTLGWRESLVAAVSVPLSFLIAFIGLWASGNTINFISLFSLILAIGILVDSGIVVVEAFHTRLVKYGNKYQAALAAIKEYAWPLIAGTFTTIAVFVPLFFLSGIVGKFIASIPYTVIFVLLASIFVALGLVPLLAIYFVRNTLSATEKRQEEYNERARAWYENYLRGLLGDRKRENRFLLIIGVLFVVALMLPAIGVVKVVFFPSDDYGLLYASIEKPQGTELSDTDISAREVEEILYQDQRIASFVTEVGSGSSFTGTGAASGAKLANVTINLVDESERKESSDEVMQDIREKLSAVTSAAVTVSSPTGGPPTGKPISVTFAGDDIGELTQTVEAAAQTLSEIPGATNIQTSARDDSAEFKIEIDSAKATELGVSPAAAADTLRTALFGAKATDIRTETEDIEVRVKLNLNPAYQQPEETNETTIEAVRELTVQGTRGPVPLSAFATISYEQANTAIRHEGGMRTATLEADVAPGANALQVMQTFLNRMEETSLPPSVEMKVGGETEDVNKSFIEMAVALLAGAALMLAILVLEFNSFRQSLYLLLIIPLSLIGVMAGLAITRSPLSFPSMLGVIALAGVIINHAIILMDSVARIGRASEGRTLTDVVIEASASRLRPIVLTTVTTVVGMIPLSFVSALWGPLAFSIMFGLAFSMILTLVVIPVLYHRWPGKRVKAQFEGKGAAL
ncbi:MAG TPA: efflux RND transporter permease subunit [Candidatus Paceibacterota bacterium]|nr:efflux RND transporter permease subunit [Candidatus Paceibacterota bacterium]